MRTRAGSTTEGAGAKARGPITEVFDEAIREAIPEAAPTRRSVITEVFDEAIRAAIPPEGEEEPQGDKAGRG